MKYLLGAVIMTGLILPVFGQQPGPKEMNGKKWEQQHRKKLDRLSEKLNLTEEQRNEILRIMEEGKGQVCAEMDRASEKVKSIRQVTDEKINAVLTPEQRARYEQIRKKRQEKVNKQNKKHVGIDCPVREQKKTK